MYYLEGYWILALMVLCHIIVDFHTQGILASMKQKKWWADNVPAMGFTHKYDKDYLAALFMHSVEWSIVVHIPFVVFYCSNPVVLASVVFNAFAHMFIDDLKCNRMKINLITDQTLHIIQIVASVLIMDCII